MAYWRDNADSYVCSACGYECNNPNKLPHGPGVCPSCQSMMSAGGISAPLTGWISVKERMPQNETPVLVTYIGMDKKIHSDGVAALLFGGLWYWWEGSVEDTECGVYVEITHWMSLPDPPEEGTR